MEKCIKARLVAVQKREERSIYIFQNLDKHQSYLKCVRCPNWLTEEVQLYQEGYITTKEVIAGVDTYYCNNDQMHKGYQKSATYFLDFIPITHVLNNGYVTTAQQLTIS